MSFLPTVPGTPFMFDTDGTTVQYINPSSVASAVPSGEKTSLLDGSISTGITKTVSTGYHFFSFAFPQARDVTGFYCTHFSNDSANCFLYTIYTSTDTTDGVDGTWALHQSYASSGVSPGWNGTNLSTRQNLYSVNWTAIKGVRLRFNQWNGSDRTLYLYNFILFGTPFNYSGLRFWHPTLDQPLTGQELDLGDVAQNGIYDRTFRIKNTNTQTANLIIISKSVMLNNTASNVQFSDGGAYANTLNIASIAPDALTGVYTMRRAVGAAEQVGLPGQARITATVGSWT